MAQDADVYQERLAAMEDQSSDFHAQNAGISRGQPKVNSDFYINRDNGLGCNSLSSLSAGNTTLSKFAGEHFGGLEIKHGEYVGDIEVDVETINPLPVHLIRPDSYSLGPDSEHIGGKNAEDRSSISSLTADLPPRMNQRDRSTLFSKNIHQIHRSSRAQFQVEVEGIRDAFDSQYQTSIDYWRRNNGSQPWYSAKPNQFDLNNKNRLDERTPPSKHEVFVSTPERDLITSEVHINKLIRSPEPSAHHNSSHLSSNNSPERTEQSANFLAYAHGRYSECSRNKRIILLLFLIALLGICVGVIAASVGTTKDDSLSNKNDKFASFEDVSYQGSQLSLEEALPKDFIDEEAYLRDGADVINSTDTQSNPPSSSSTMNESGPGKSNMPTSSPFLSSSQTHNSLSPTLSSIQKATNSPTSNPSPSPTTLAPSRQPSFIPTPMPSRPPSTPPTSVPTPTPSQSPPSQSPTHKPSRQPSQPPTSNPSRRPSQQPSVKLTRRPTPRPSTDNPTRRPTDMPSPKPSSPPSKEPSKSPSQNPTTLAPSEAPTLKPSESPTHKPSTLAPSITPTLNPSKSPSQKPTTLAPSKAPTLKPSTASPTDGPSWSPSAAPITLSPTSLPSNVPTTLPPYSLPSASPSLKPSLSPSVTPTVKPTTLEPSRRPTSRSPTSNPITYEPSISPSITQTSSPMASLTPGPSTLAVITDPPTPITLTSAPAPTTKVPTSSPVSDTTDEPSVSTTSIFPTYAPTLA